MADSGIVNSENLTDRQREIAENAATILQLNFNDITTVLLINNIPDTLNVVNNTGAYSRNIIPLYGEILTDSEHESNKQFRLNQVDNNLESLNGFTTLFGLRRNPSITGIASGRIRVENSPSDVIDPSNNRLISSGLPFGAQQSVQVIEQRLVKFATPNGSDHRVYLRDKSGQFIKGGNQILAPLLETDGLLFPYTPSISFGHEASYGSESLTHANYDHYFYRGSATNAIGINATFTAKNQKDARYVLAAQHFLRSVTKMFYGQDSLAGTPPPVLRLEGYGDLQFSSVPVIITSFTSTLPIDVDYISTSMDLPIQASESRAARGSFRAAQEEGFFSRPEAREDTSLVPTKQDFSITCQPVYSRSSVSDEFSLAKFSSGQLLSVKNGRGGFM